MFDLLISNGTVVTPGGAGEWDIAVQDGRIAALARRGALDGSAHELLDAGGMLVVPGGIDPHVHCNSPIDPPEGGGPWYTAPPPVVSRAALWGGTTTLVDFAWRDPDETIDETLGRYDDLWSGGCHCDYSYHVTLRGEIPPHILDEIPQVISRGFPSFKIFTSDVFPSNRVQVGKMPFGSLWELMKLTAEHNGIVAVHAEDDDLVMHMYDKLFREGRTGFENMPLVHSSLSEDLSFRRVIRLAEHVPGAAVYMMHVSAALGVEAIAESRARGFPVYGETLPQYALQTEEVYAQPDGMKWHTYPSLRTREDTDALWQGVKSGDIATFATDELCTSFAVKTSGARIDDVVGGNTGVEPRMAIIYTEVANRRGLGLDRFVDLSSANAARILGLYPRKGAIAVGSDADLVILDPGEGRTLTASDLHESDYTPWEGWRVDAWPVATLLRGKIVVEDGEFSAGLDDGQLVPRTLDRSVCEGSAVA